MREILFRGKRQYTGEWAESVCPLGVMHAGHLCDDFEPSTVGQYTGLTDKNGKRIFEGDKCRVTRTCVLAYGSIEFFNGCFWFSDDGEGGKLRLCDVAINGFTIEVLEGGRAT